MVPAISASARPPRGRRAARRRLRTRRPPTLRKITDEHEAARERFLGSPTLRINGRDVEPGATERTDYGLKCRIYRTADGLSGLPAEDWILAALTAD